MNRMMNMIPKHSTFHHKFVCFTDRKDLIKKDPCYKQLPVNVARWKGRLPKFYIHSTDSGLKGRILFLDLDTVIVGNIDHLAKYDGYFCGVSAHRLHKPIKSARNHVAGGLLSFEAGATKYLWDEVDSNVAKYSSGRFKGNERFILHHLLSDYDYWQALYPGHVVSYKFHCKGGIPEGARVIQFHGKPRPHDVKDSWISEYWK